MSEARSYLSLRRATTGVLILFMHILSPQCVSAGGDFRDSDRRLASMATMVGQGQPVTSTTIEDSLRRTISGAKEGEIADADVRGRLALAAGLVHAAQRIQQDQVEGLRSLAQSLDLAHNLVNATKSAHNDIKIVIDEVWKALGRGGNGSSRSQVILSDRADRELFDRRFLVSGSEITAYELIGDPSSRTARWAKPQFTPVEGGLAKNLHRRLGGIFEAGATLPWVVLIPAQTVLRPPRGGWESAAVQALRAGVLLVALEDDETTAPASDILSLRLGGTRIKGPETIAMIGLGCDCMIVSISAGKMSPGEAIEAIVKLASEISSASTAKMPTFPALSQLVKLRASGSAQSFRLVVSSSAQLLAGAESISLSPDDTLVLRQMHPLGDWGVFEVPGGEFAWLRMDRVIRPPPPTRKGK